MIPWLPPVVSQIFVSLTEDYGRFDYLEVSEGEAAQFCVVVWGPLTQSVELVVQASDGGQAVGECV